MIVQENDIEKRVVFKSLLQALLSYQSSAVKILHLGWRTSNFIRLLSITGGGGRAFYLNSEFFEIRYNKLLCYSFAHVNLFLARSWLYTSLLVMHS